MTVTPKQKVGNIAEQRACDYLLTKGFELITKNYRCKRGEVDLIMHDSDDIVFIEVRSRAYANFGSAIESINRTKQQKIIRAALFFLHERQWIDNTNWRFDVIGINGNHLEWIKDAFTADTL